jgi:hypothetical protein
MADMELLQFHRLLYSSLEEVSAENDAPAALPREKAPLFVCYGAGRGAQGPSGDFGKGKVFISY